MLESFPFGRTSDQLEEEDFSLFANGYRHLVAARIPSSGNIHFILGGTLPKLSTDPRIGSEIGAAIEAMRRSELQVMKISDTILLSFELGNGRVLVVGVHQIDPMIAELGTSDWLEDTRESLLREFRQLKSSYRDLETGLLNSAHFMELLDVTNDGNGVGVILVQLPSRSRWPRDAFRNSQRAAAALTDFTDSRFLVHHLGQCVFAILVGMEEIGSVEGFCAKLAQHLKREGFHRVHIGSCRTRSGEAAHSLVLDQAWTALQVAAKRGPFSFCDYSFIAYADRHPLREIDAPVTLKYRQLARRDPVFSVIYLSEPERAEGQDRILDLIDLPKNATVLGIDRGLLIYVSGVGGDAGLSAARELLSAMVGTAEVSDVYAGICSYPYRAFSKTEILLNARKALLHAAFLGAGHVVRFDGVSLNVSGDIYFGDGDLSAALREYRRGLECAPEDVNLLNSLGVTYALLNKNSLARAAFERVIVIDPNNYMALYNLGLGAQLRGDVHGAVELFEKAYRGCNLDDSNDFCREVEVQLGKLYCRAGMYGKSLECLENWRNKVGERKHNRILKCLGEAYLGAGNPGTAMKWLQRALQQNAFDQDVLSLLGVATWEAREGDEIALAFCQKSVDLAPDNPLLRFRLARLQQDLGQYTESLENLTKCRGNKVDLAEVQLLKAQLYRQMKSPGKARYWARKAQKQCSVKNDVYRQAQTLLDAVQ